MNIELESVKSIAKVASEGGSKALVDEFVSGLTPAGDRLNELVAKTRKIVGSSTFTVEEGTKSLSLQKSPGRRPNFDPAEVEYLINLSEHSYVERLVDGDNERFSEITRAGTAIFKAHEKLYHLAEAVEEAARDSKYTTLIADDVSGRFPALYVHDHMQRLADLRGTTPPKLVFMAGGYPGVGADNVSRLKPMLERIEEDKETFKNGRAMLITDLIEHGGSVRQFNDAFTQAGVKFDIATMESFHDFRPRRDLKNYNARIYSGSGVYNMYTGGPGGTGSLRNATGVEKYGGEATVRRTDYPQDRANRVRNELYKLSRYSFEKNH